jgi:DNA-binding NtrC family response regulator
MILCDVMMPEMTGMDLHEALRRRAPDVLPRIVFMTGGAFTDRAREFLQSVGITRIDKPLDLDQLRTLIDDAPEHRVNL